MKFIIARFKDDYDQLSDENELNIFENYTKQSKLYAYVIIGKHVNVYANVHEENLIMIL